MKFRNTILFLGSIALLFQPLSAQNSEQELPAAPSTTVQRNKPQRPSPSPQPAAEPQPTPQTPAPGESVKPASQQSATDAQQSETSKGSADSPETSQSDEAATTIRKTVNEVNVVFTVTDKHGRYIKGLKKDDFKVIDDTKPAAEIRSFHSE